MSRSNPYKLKPARPQTTVIIIGEGETEGAFLCHLKSLYCFRGSGVQVKVDWTYGGSPRDIIREAMKLTLGAEYSRSILLMDTDLKWPDEDVQIANQKGLEIIGAKPCIEALMLKILDPTKNWESASTRDCKKHFHDNYLEEDHKLDPSRYEKVLSKDILEMARKKISELDTIIKRITDL
jgi:hypothetical protein